MLFYSLAKRENTVKAINSKEEQQRLPENYIKSICSLYEPLHHEVRNVRIPTYQLESGDEMPVLGLGTWRLTGQTCVAAVSKALELGYNHIDTADAYGNHRQIAQGLEGTDRSAIFVTSKVPHSSLHYDEVLRTCRKNLEELRTDYLDMYLIHWPNRQVPMAETFAALEELHGQGKVRSIGVSNFTIRHLQQAMAATNLPICTNQVEFHPLLYQKELLEFCQQHNIVVTAYSPLARGNVFGNNVISAIAEEYGKTPAQISLRWLLQKGIIVIPKASSEAHLRENMDIFDWELSAADEEGIDNIEEEQRLINVDIAEF